MGHDRDFFDEVFKRKSFEETRQLYDDWAENYEKAHADMGGYLAPGRCAKALLQFVTDRSLVILDVGCGTGLGAQALRELGFSSIVGTDISPGMLKQAGEKPGLYQALYQGDLNDPLPIPQGSVSHAIAAGVLSPSHAPASCLFDVMNLLPESGCFSFSLNDHSLEDPSYQSAIDELVSKGRAIQLFREHDINVPGT
ncbi:MAG: methyltransferase domain-containing protein, partial [Pseudomonadota bacterium]